MIGEFCPKVFALRNALASGPKNRDGAEISAGIVTIREFRHHRSPGSSAKRSIALPSCTIIISYLNGFVGLTTKKQTGWLKSFPDSISRALNKFGHLYAIWGAGVETAGENRPTWQPECYDFLEPAKTLRFLGLDGEGCQQARLVENARLAASVIISTLGKESTWRKSLFVWAREKSKSPNCCCRVVTIRKLLRSSRWPDGRSRRTSIVSSSALELTAVSNESNSRQPYTGGSYVWRRAIRKTHSQRTGAAGHRACRPRTQEQRSRRSHRHH